MTVIGCDPGTTESALVWWNGQALLDSYFGMNTFILARVRGLAYEERTTLAPTLAIEQFESQGMLVGKEVFETVRWGGRFEEAYYPLPVAMVTRRAVKLHLCGSMKAKDANVRQALLDRFGEKGTKKAPGLLHPLSGHLWAAFAIAVTYHDQQSGSTA